MTYQFDFFRRTRDAPAGKIFRRWTADFADLQAAKAYGVSELTKASPAEAADGCRIYLGGDYKSTVSIHS